MLTWKHLLQICWPYIYDPNLPASHPKGALLKWYLVAVEAILKQWSHRHVQETSLSWFELCDRGSHWKMTKEDNTQAGCNLKQYWVGTKRPCSRKTSHTSLYHLQHKLLTQGRMDLFFHVVDSNIKKKNQTHETWHQFQSVVKFRWASMNCSISFLFSAERSDLVSSAAVPHSQVFQFIPPKSYIFYS